MAIYMPSDTKNVIREDASKCGSRSLYLDRFADPLAKDAGDKAPRRKWFNKLLELAVERQSHDWMDGVPGVVKFYSQLQSRLMVNMAGGVMENAGLCLDRFGLPYIPGSAVKGCARRMALQELFDLCHPDVGQTSGLPVPGTSGSEMGQEDGPQSSPEPSGQRPDPQINARAATMLAAIARIFGWSEQDWSLALHKKEKRFISNFAWACGENASEVFGLTANALAAELSVPVSESHRSMPWKLLPNFGGAVSFLPAYPIDVGATGHVDGLPIDVPSLGKLELDVLTCHHKEYYSEPDRQKHSEAWEKWNRQWSHAPDTEEPVPVFFPAIAPGHVFAFSLRKLRHCSDEDLRQACSWLQSGLEVFGLGAKTNAGYGWFDCSMEIQDNIHSLRQKKAMVEQEKRRNELQAAQAKADEQERIAQKRKRDEMMTAMSEEDREDFRLDEMNLDQRIQWIEKFHLRTDPEKQAIYRFLNARNPDLWRDLRQKAEKGKQKEKKRFGPVVQAMFKMAKEKREKMP